MSIINLEGKVFGKLLVLEKDLVKTKAGDGAAYWKCKCECGNVKSIRSDVLRKRNVSHCGCVTALVKIGDKFNLLTVIDTSNKIARSKYWKCLCECGNIIHVDTYGLTHRQSKSCGCLVSKFRQGERAIKIGEIRPYFWSRIEYGAKTRKIEFNITPLDAWNLWLKQKGFCAITKIALTLPAKAREQSKATASLDRINSSKGYTIDNIQWIHKDINMMKNSFNMEYFTYLCRLVTNNSEYK